MFTFLWFIFFSVFVYTESVSHKSKPRAVNLALETVIEFDNKDRAYDLKFIDQVQGFLNKVKYVLNKDQNYRRAGRAGQPELKFSDFIRSTLAIINTYEDDDLEKILRTFNQEARKFNYRGCKFHELVQNTSLRRYIGKKLDELKEMPLEDVRDSIDELLKKWNGGKLGEHNELLLNYLDSLYEDDASEKLAVVLTDMDLYKSDKKQKSSIDLFDIVRKGLRSLVFDHYTNLKAKQRNDVRLKLESAWNENAEEKSHNFFDSYLATDMNRLIKTEFETTSKKVSKFKHSKKDENAIGPRGSNEDSTKRSHDSDDEDDDGSTKELKNEKSTSSSSESEETEETKTTNKIKKKTTTKSHNDMAEESPVTTAKQKLKLLSVESKEMTTTKKKHRKQSHNIAKQKTTKYELKATASVEKALKSDERVKFKASQENSKNSDDEDKKISHNFAKEKTSKFQLKTTATLQSSIEKAPIKSKRVKIASQENSKSSDNEDEVSSTITTTVIRKHRKEKAVSKTDNPKTEAKTKKDKSSTKKHSKNKAKYNSDGIPHNYTETVVHNSTHSTDETTVALKHKKNRKSKAKLTHDSHHAVAFRNFDLSDQDASDTKTPRSTTDYTLATDDVQDSSDYEVTRKSRKSFTKLASNEGMSIESFEAHKSHIRKNNNDDSFLPKPEVVKEVVPNALLNRLSQLEQELKLVKSQITVATERQTKLSVESQKPAFDTLGFREGTSKIVLNENKDTTSIPEKTTNEYEIETSHVAKATRINNIQKSMIPDFKVITRDKTAITKTVFEQTTKSETLQKGTTGRMTKTIQFDSPNYRTNTSENDQPNSKEASDKKIFISVENESPNTTYEFLVPFNFSNTNINYEVQVVTNVETTENFLKHSTLNATVSTVINEISNNKTLQPDLRSGMPNLLHDENNDVNDEFDADDLLVNN